MPGVLNSSYLCTMYVYVRSSSSVVVLQIYNGLFFFPIKATQTTFIMSTSVSIVKQLKRVDRMSDELQLTELY